MTEKFDTYFDYLLEQFDRHSIENIIRRYQRKILALNIIDYDTAAVDIYRNSKLQKQTIREYEEFINNHREEITSNEEALSSVQDFDETKLKHIESRYSY